ncbi:MAG: glycine/sarcosine/betaine reductase selenoprotein B family protein [Acidobacteriota bacterium]
MQNYPFLRYEIADNPVARMSKPLNECKVALITSAGLRLENDKPFKHSNKLGDVSFREISNEIEVQSLIEDHKSSAFDHLGIESDKNLALPIDRFKELVRNKAIGSLNHRSFSFMGSIINPRKLINETAPQVTKLLKEDEIDCVFLTPV